MEVVVFLVVVGILWVIIKGFIKLKVAQTKGKYFLAQANIKHCLENKKAPSWSGTFKEIEFIQQVEELLRSDNLHIPRERNARNAFVASAAIGASAMEMAGGNFSDQCCFAATFIKLLYAEHGTYFFENNA